jgi:hypothetical protein
MADNGFQEIPLACLAGMVYLLKRTIAGQIPLKILPSASCRANERPKLPAKGAKAGAGV